MSFEVSVSDNAKQFVEYLEAFSFANQLTQSIKNESITIFYRAIFNSRMLEVESRFSVDEMKMKVRWKPEYGARYIDTNEFFQIFQSIKGVLKGEASYDDLKQSMSFVVSDFENLNMLIDLLTEGFKF